MTNYPLRSAILKYIETGDAEEYNNCLNIVKDDYPKFVQNNLMNIIGSHDTSRIANEVERIDSAHKKELIKMASLLEYSFIGIPTIFYGDEVGVKNIKANISRTPYPWGNEDRSLLYWFKKLGEFRKLKSIVKGSMQLVKHSDGIIEIVREEEEEKVIIVTNNSDSDYTLSTDEKYYEIITGSTSSKNTFTVPSKGVLVIKRMSKE